MFLREKKSSVEIIMAGISARCALINLALYALGTAFIAIANERREKVIRFHLSLLWPSRPAFHLSRKRQTQTQITQSPVERSSVSAPPPVRLCRPVTELPAAISRSRTVRTPP
ncbi:hypothetical protein KFK09_022426 [Dendrobium nobile]|uniref:Uncharacterized protein n=1 Tax=Dendrobium nobile TaxID=94219 RepID=A0A8T3AIL5_DENNO|nr:hypothetical protein KFK09_022426 [Dendrobium nobile]